MLLSHKKKKRNNAICSDEDGSRDPTKSSKPDKYKYRISLVCGILEIKIQMNLFIKQQ